MILRDHPHACGDKYILLYIHTQKGGSSPRVWGQDNITDFNIWCIRIIPTRVGTRCLTKPPTSTHRDHPHACGDKQALRLTASTAAGSSPRVWGQGYNRFSSSTSHRIIPTRVGTSEEIFTRNSDEEDHPHACGDKWTGKPWWRNNKGSSPRVWGQVSLFHSIL